MLQDFKNESDNIGTLCVNELNSNFWGIFYTTF